METRTDLQEYLGELSRAKSERRDALNHYNEALARYRSAFVPLREHPSPDGVRELYSFCPDGTAYPRSHVLVCLVLLYYAPEALYGGKLSLRLAKLIAGVLGVKHEAVYIARNKVAAWLRVYPDFFCLVSDLFFLISLSAEGQDSVEKDL